HLAGLTSPSPPRRPPVPYTTLFRSAGHGHLRTVLPALRSPVAGQQRGSAPGLSLVPGVPGDLHRHVGAEPVAAHRSFRGPGALGAVAGPSRDGDCIGGKLGCHPPRPYPAPCDREKVTGGRGMSPPALRPPQVTRTSRGWRPGPDQRLLGMV